MSSDRLTKLAFKQIVRKEWMDRTLDFVLAEMPEKEIRQYLDEYISTQQQKGGEGIKRNKSTYGMSVIMLSCWFRKDEELDSFRKDLINEARKYDKSDWLPFHMAMLSAAYPFWYKVCTIVGNLFSLQERISSTQIYDRMKALFGDRETIARNTRYAVRTMVSWGLLKDCLDRKGHYEKGPVFEITNPKLVALLLEGVLLSFPEGRAELNDLNRNAGLFGFDFCFLSGGMLSDLTQKRVEITNFDTTSVFASVRP